jgi:hypothetical protein
MMLSDARLAHELIEKAQVQGKIVLTMGEKSFLQATQTMLPILCTSKILWQYTNLEVIVILSIIQHGIFCFINESN